MVCAAPFPFGCLVVLLMFCPVGLLGSFCLWCSCWCVLLSSWFCCAPLCAWVGPAAPVLFLAFCLAPLSVLFCFPSSGGLSCLVPWSSSYIGVLVRPSGYLVAAATAYLPCFHAGDVVRLCHPSVICPITAEIACPVWGFHPPRHVAADLGGHSSAILQYS